MFSDEVLMKKDRKFDRNEGKQRPRNKAPNKHKAIKDSMELGDLDYDEKYNGNRHERRRRETDSDPR